MASVSIDRLGCEASTLIHSSNVMNLMFVSTCCMSVYMKVLGQSTKKCKAIKASVKVDLPRISLLVVPLRSQDKLGEGATCKETFALLGDMLWPEKIVSPS